MSLAAILRNGIERIADDDETKSLFQSFEGDSVALYLRGDKTVTFTVKDGRPVVLEGEVPNPTAVADIDALEFLRFADGRTHFAELFTTEFGTYFDVKKGKFDELGGDFMLLGPVSDRLIKLYREDTEFRDMVDKYKHSK